MSTSLVVGVRSHTPSLVESTARSDSTASSGATDERPNAPDDKPQDPLARYSALNGLHPLAQQQASAWQEEIGLTGTKADVSPVGDVSNRILDIAKTVDPATGGPLNPLIENLEHFVPASDVLGAPTDAVGGQAPIDQQSGSQQHLGTVSRLPIDVPGLNDPSEQEGSLSHSDLPNLFGFDPAHDLNIPGGEAGLSVGEWVVVLGHAAWEGAKAGKAGGPAGAATGAAVAVAVALADAAVVSTIDWLLDHSDTYQDPPPPTGEQLDGGVPMGVSPVDPKKTPNPEEGGGNYTPKFMPSLAQGRQGVVNVPRPAVDPVLEGVDEPLGVLRQFDQAVDPNPDASDVDRAGALRAILTSNQAVTDPIPDRAGSMATVANQQAR